MKMNRWLLRNCLFFSVFFTIRQLSGQFSQNCVIEGNPISRRVAEKLIVIFKNGFHHCKEHKEYY